MGSQRRDPNDPLQPNQLPNTPLHRSPTFQHSLGLLEEQHGPTLPHTDRSVQRVYPAQPVLLAL